CSAVYAPDLPRVGRRHAQHARLERLDPVTDLRRALELELLRGLAHLPPQRAHALRQLRGRQRRELVLLLGDRHGQVVRLADGDQRHLRQVETLAQQVDADQHVELAAPQVADDVDTLDGLDVGVDVAHADADLLQVVGQVLGHLLGEGGDQDTLRGGDALADLLEQVVHLVARGADDHLGVGQTRRADQLLDDAAAGLADLPLPGGGRDVERLAYVARELLEVERAVVERGREAEAELDQRLFSGAVSSVHAADLWHGDVALVDDEQVVLGEVVEERVGRLPRGAAVEVARVVLDAGAEAHLGEELDADRPRLLVRREDLHHVASHPEGAAVEVVVAALVLHVDQLAQHDVALHLGLAVEEDEHVEVARRRAQAVDAGHARHHDDV